MDERFKYKRIEFKGNKAQEKFLQRIIERSGGTKTTFAQSLNISMTTLKNWRKGTTRLPFEIASVISMTYKVPLPKIARVVSFYSHLQNISFLGGKANARKNIVIGGNQKYRQIAWQKWWDTKGRHSKHPIINVRKQITIPKKSARLSEFLGIMLGDGGISKYQVTITLNRYDDKEYARYVVSVIRDLFAIEPAIRLYTDAVRKSVVKIEVSSRELVEYLVDLGLVIGNKVQNQVEVPNWIIKNKKYSIACLRGLIDTDGCVYTNTYTVARKVYSYKKIAFSNRSRPLLNFVRDVWVNTGLTPTLAKGVDVRITSTKDVKKYMATVGTHNLKHLKRFQI
jgi:hypothetical protein